MANESSSQLTNSSTATVTSLSAGSLVFAVSMGCIMALAVCGNILVILAVWSTKNLRTTAAVLVVNLAIVDLSITITVVPFVVTTAVTQEWVLPQTVCKITAFVNAFLTASQIMALLHISVNRYIAVVYPHHYKTRCNKRGTFAVVMSGWLYSLVWTSLPLFGWGKLGFIRGTLFCNILWSGDLAYAITVQVLCYFMPSIVGGILYLNVYKHVRQQGKRMLKNTLSVQLQMNRRKSRTESNHNDMSPTNPSPLSFDNLAVSKEDIGEKASTDTTTSTMASRARRTRRRSAVDARVTKTLLAIVAAFVCCWFPRGIANLWAIFAGREDVPRALEYSSTLFVFFNAAVNPLLYGALHQDFKRAFKAIICCEYVKAKGSTRRADTNGSG